MGRTRRSRRARGGREAQPGPSQTSPAPRASWLPALPLGLAIAGLALAFTTGYLWNEDLWWYLSSGQRILQERAIPSDDPFLWPAENRGLWITHSWLWTVLVASIHGASGIAGLTAASSVIAIVLVVLVFTAGRGDFFALANAGLSTAVLWTLNHRLALKAELASWLLLLVFLRLLDSAKGFDWRRSSLLVILQWLWSHLHGGYPLGIVITAVYAVFGRWPKRAEGAPPLWLPGALLAVSLASPGLFAERLRVLGSFIGLKGAVEGLPDTFISEWQPTFAGPFDLYAGMVLLALVWGGVGLLLASGPKRWIRAVVLLLFAGLSLTAVRFVPPFVMVSAALTLANLADSKRRLDGPARSRFGRVLHASAATLLVAFLLVVAWSLRLARDDFEIGQSRGGGATLSPLSTAPAAADYLASAQPSAPIFNDMFLGGYLSFRLYPELRFFIDNRNLSEPLLATYAKAIDDPAAWRTLAARRDIGTAVVSGVYTEGSIREALSFDPSWHLVYLDPTAVVFRRDASTEPILRPWSTDGRTDRVPFLCPGGVLHRIAHRFLQQEPDDLLVTWERHLLGMRRFRDVASLADAALESRPDLRRVQWLRATARLQLAEVAGAIEDMEAVLRAPAEEGLDELEARLQLATTLMRSGRGREAVPHLERAARLAPNDRRVPALLQRARGAG